MQVHGNRYDLIIVYSNFKKLDSCLSEKEKKSVRVQVVELEKKLAILCKYSSNVNEMSLQFYINSRKGTRG